MENCTAIMRYIYGMCALSLPAFSLPLAPCTPLRFPSALPLPIYRRWYAEQSHAELRRGIRIRLHFRDKYYQLDTPIHSRHSRSKAKVKWSLILPLLLPFLLFLMRCRLLPIQTAETDLVLSTVEWSLQDGKREMIRVRGVRGQERVTHH